MPPFWHKTSDKQNLRIKPLTIVFHIVLKLYFKIKNEFLTGCQGVVGVHECVYSIIHCDEPSTARHQFTRWKWVWFTRFSHASWLSLSFLSCLLTRVPHIDKYDSVMVPMEEDEGLLPCYDEGCVQKFKQLERLRILQFQDSTTTSFMYLTIGVTF